MDTLQRLAATEEIRQLAHRYALAGAQWARGVFAYAGEREMLELALAHAPDAESRKDLSGRIKALGKATPSSRDVEVPSEGVGRTSWYSTPRLLAAAVVIAALALGSLGVVRLVRGPPLPPLAPLPEGLLLYVEAADWEGYAVMDPERPA